MDRIGKINFRKIKRISPSQFYSMKNCAYKSLLAEAYEKKPLLPVSPNAYFGIVLHKMLELIAKGQIKNESEFNKYFDNQVKEVEDSLLKNGFTFFLPLQKNVRDFGLKKILVKKHLRTNIEMPSKPYGKSFYSERWYETNDKLLAGKIDLVIETGMETEIIDFKTGAITEDVLDDTGEVFVEVKEEYKEQLKLYAYLYFKNTGKFPTSLSLVDLAKQKFSIEFSRSECSSIFEEAKTLLQTTNDGIEKGIFHANPSETNCKYCLYRPACSFFIEKLESDFSFNDVSGSVKNVVKYHNGNVSVILQSGLKEITVTSFPSEKFIELTDFKNRKINIFNLRKEAIEHVYSASKTTMIYE